jgi:hypothetical protein
MRAKVTKRGGFRGKANDSPRCIHYAEDTEIDGDIAVTAVREKWATPLDEKAPPAKRPPADKAVKAAPEIK